MADIAFYHLLHSPLEKALPAILDKVQASGLRALVLAENEALIKSLDTALWTYGGSKFLAHSAAEDEYVAEQPIFLTRTEENPNGAEVLVALEGRQPEFAKNFSRVLDMFDGHDEVQVQAARKRWKAYQAEGHSLTYWKQEQGGGWKKEAA